MSARKLTDPRPFLPATPLGKRGVFTYAGRWTVALELRGASARLDRALAYQIAAALSIAFTLEGFDIRVVESGTPLVVAVTVEVTEDAEFWPVIAAMIKAAEGFTPAQRGWT